ncbi:hypothetical protein X975_20875, partial [Stegodyphus mimosarum]
PSPGENNDEESFILPLSYGAHPAIDCASSAIDINHDKQKGR